MCSREGGGGLISATFVSGVLYLLSPLLMSRVNQRPAGTVHNGPHWGGARGGALTEEEHGLAPVAAAAELHAAVNERLAREPQGSETQRRLRDPEEAQRPRGGSERLNCSVVPVSRPLTSYQWEVRGQTLVNSKPL